MSHRRRVVIMGAGGRDFHVFNTCYRDDETHEVVAFTATQIPGIDHRSYPAVLAGPHYPDGIPILPESEIESIIDEQRVEHVVFAYSDVSNEYVEGVRRRIEATGASFTCFDPERTLLQSTKPCIAICAVRTGCGKSALSRYVVAALRKLGLRAAALRHPMPYGNLRDQVVQRFARVEDLARHHCTIEEMEEYEPHIQAGNVVFAGADYQKILDEAEKEADIIIWDGGNNDTPFVRPDVLLTLVDPLRAGHEVSYFPALWNLTHADVLVIAKTDEADAAGMATVRSNIEIHNPKALVIKGRSPIELADEDAVRGKRVLVIEDGPTLTHGGMAFGAGYLAAKRAGAAEIVDPRPHAVGRIKVALATYPHVREILPALGYGAGDIADLEATINAVDCDVIVSGTPIDISRIVKMDKPCVRATYHFEEVGVPRLADLLGLRFAPQSAS